MSSSTEAPDVLIHSSPGCPHPLKPRMYSSTEPIKILADKGSSRASDESRMLSRDSGPSSADKIDDWGAAKKSTMFGGGFDRRDRGERGGLFDSQSRADESDSWVSNKSFVPSTGARRFGSNSGGFDTHREDGVLSLTAVAVVQIRKIDGGRRKLLVPVALSIV
ncbi:hypothetical protein RJ640_012518 [Escallonia rubra]|uniref:Uncharacterized protein n=1 Tax=Escallonia rubra TaxID=112253 RepID=A0AA88UMC8_9ASTE|nr:hypothetical protein RJ640_012518 [Escallonia rubra]